MCLSLRAAAKGSAWVAARLACLGLGCVVPSYPLLAKGGVQLEEGRGLLAGALWPSMGLARLCPLPLPPVSPLACFWSYGWQARAAVARCSLLTLGIDQRSPSELALPLPPF